MKTLFVLSLVLLAGCTTARYSRTEPGSETWATNEVGVVTHSKTRGETIRFGTASFATKKAIGDINYSAGTNGLRTFGMKGYANDQVQAIGIAVEAAVKAGVEAAKHP